MHKLDDPVLLEKCVRIKDMIEKVAADPKRQQDYYAQYHHWQLSPPLELSEIEKFEDYSGVELPVEYVYFLTNVGRGGASPGTGLNNFESKWGLDEDINKESRQLFYPMSNEEWEQMFDDDELDDYYYGTVELCGMDLTYNAYLVVTGPMSGKIVYLDYGSSLPPMWPKGFPDFLTWYESFFSELISGYDISPTWKFMWQEPGNADILISAFQNTMDNEYRKDVLCSFCKFPTLSAKAYEFIKGISDPELQDTIKKVLAHFISNTDKPKPKKRKYPKKETDCLFNKRAEKDNKAPKYRH